MPEAMTEQTGARSVGAFGCDSPLRPDKTVSVRDSATFYALCVHVQGIPTACRGHEQPIAMGASETYICTTFGQCNMSDGFPPRGEYPHTIKFIVPVPHAHQRLP